MILYTASHIALGVLCKEPTLESVLADFNRKHLEIDKVRVTHDYIPGRPIINDSRLDGLAVTVVCWRLFVDAERLSERTLFGVRTGVAGGKSPCVSAASPPPLFAAGLCELTVAASA